MNYLFKIILQYISCWWWCSNSRAIDFHSFLDFLLPTYFTYIHPKIWTIFRLSALKFLLSRFYDSLIHSASNYNQKRAKNTQEVQVILRQIWTRLFLLFQSGTAKKYLEIIKFGEKMRQTDFVYIKFKSILQFFIPK